MKKILSIFGVLIFVGGLVLSSCNSTNRLCPAYPPSVLQGDVEQGNDNQIINDFKIIEIQKDQSI